MSAKEIEPSDFQYYREIATLFIGLMLGLLLGYLFFHQKTSALDETKAEKAGQQAAKAFQKGLTEELQKTFGAPEPQEVSGDFLRWMEEIAAKSPDKIAPDEICVLFADDGYYKRVLNKTEAQAEAIYENKYKGKASDWFQVYIEDTSSHTIEGIWPLSPIISFRASLPYSANKTDLTRINKGEVWMIEGNFGLLFADTGKIWLDNCRLIGKFMLPSGWKLNDPRKLTPEMFIPLEEL